MKKEFLLAVEPRPLLFSHEKIVVSWSPKAACSYALLWFFEKEGLLQEALTCHQFPHRYRLNVYGKSESYKLSKKEFIQDDLSNWTLLKITRDPTKRLVSSFRHAIRHDFMDELGKQHLFKDFSTEGISFTEFSKLLGTQDLTVRANRTIDIHVRKQSHPIWNAGFGQVRTINVDEVDMNTELNLFSKDYGLGITNFDDNLPYKNLETSHHARDSSINTAGVPIEEFKFIRHNSQNSFPKFDLLSSRFVQEASKLLYASDFALVKSGHLKRANPKLRSFLSVLLDKVGY